MLLRWTVYTNALRVLLYMFKYTCRNASLQWALDKGPEEHHNPTGLVFKEQSPIREKFLLCWRDKLTQDCEDI